MMLPKRVLTAGALSMAMTAPALAEEHMIILTGFSYFPAVTYAKPGDTVRFVNESGETETVVGKDTGWVVGPLSDQEQGTLVVSEETELAFFSAYGECNNGNDGADGNCGSGNDDDDPDYGSYEEAEIKAEISFDEPDLQN